MELFIEVLIYIPEGVHAAVLLLEVVLKVPVVLLQVVLLDFHLLESSLEESALVLCFFDGFLHLEDLFPLGVFELSRCCLLLQLSIPIHLPQLLDLLPVLDILS